MQQIRAAVCIVACAAILWAGVASAQGSSSGVNPNISAIVDARARAFDATPDELSFDLEEFELAAQGALNPFARGDVFLGVSTDEVHIEEAYITFTALPGGFSARAGQWLTFVGRHNREHPHVFSYLDHPLLVREYLGGEGWSSVGAQLSTLLDVGSVPLTLTAEVLDRGPGAGGHAHGHEEESHEEEHEDSSSGAPGRTLGDLAYNGRASMFLTLGESTWLDFGASAGTGIYDEDENLRQVWYGADAKFKWAPNQYTSLTVVAEFLGNAYDVIELEPGILAVASGPATSRPFGFFANVDYRFNRKWNVGALVDYAQEIEDPEHDQLGVGAFGGFSLFEESTLIRLLARRDYVPEEKDPFSVQLQVVFSLGPHKPHQF